MLPLAESSGNFLVSPSLGLMLWTLILFLVTMWVLSKFAYPLIQAALEQRANAIRDNIEASEKQRDEADELLADYSKQLAVACEQTAGIIALERKGSGDAHAGTTAAGNVRGADVVS